MSQNNPRDNLLKILEIVGYEGNKEWFVDNFLRLCQQQAIVDLINSLPEDQQSKLTEVVRNEKEPENLKPVLDQYFSKDQLDTALKESSKNKLLSYVSNVTPSLTEEQKNNLESHLKSLA